MKFYGWIWLLAVCLLAGCSTPQGSSASGSYPAAAQAVVKATKTWLEHPKDQKLLLQACKLSDSAVQDFAKSKSAGLTSYTNLGLLQASLETVKPKLENGEDPTLIDSSSQTSPVESVRIVLAMVESNLQGEERKASATPAP
jgi:hypothetical protein